MIVHSITHKKGKSPYINLLRGSEGRTILALTYQLLTELIEIPKQLEKSLKIPVKKKYIARSRKSQNPKSSLQTCMSVIYNTQQLSLIARKLLKKKTLALAVCYFKLA